MDSESLLIEQGLPETMKEGNKMNFDASWKTGTQLNTQNVFHGSVSWLPPTVQRHATGDGETGNTNLAIGVNWVWMVVCLCMAHYRRHEFFWVRGSPGSSHCSARECVVWTAGASSVRATILIGDGSVHTAPFSPSGGMTDCAARF